MDFKNKNIVITGSSRGIGWSLACAFAKSGARLHLVQRSYDDGAIKTLKSYGAAEIICHTCDLTQFTEVVRLGEQLRSENIDVLINNAGILTGELLEKQTPEDIFNVFQLNLTTSAILIRAVLPSMITRRTGRIVNNASVSAFMRFPCATTYAAAKSGLLALTECLDTELSGTGVSALALITPGIKTDMFDAIKTSYGKYFEAPQDYISADEYAVLVLNAIQSGQRYLWPTNRTTRFGLWLAKYAPGLFKKIVVGGFRRPNIN